MILPRILKAPEVRKNELVSAAEALFLERGYDRTSVDEIIARAGVSKGAFYHYFPSKEAVLEALAARRADDSMKQIEGIIQDETLNAFERLNAFFDNARRLKKVCAPEIMLSFEAIFRPENLVLYHRMYNAVSEVVAPVVATIIAQGIEEGTFECDDPAITSEILVSLMATSHDVVARLFNARDAEEFEDAAAAFERRCVGQGIAIDRILGLPDGSVQFIEPGFAGAIFASWRTRHTASAASLSGQQAQ